MVVHFGSEPGPLVIRVLFSRTQHREEYLAQACSGFRKRPALQQWMSDY